MEASMEYPKSLYLKGWEDLSATVIVCDEKEEAEARKQGYKMLKEQTASLTASVGSRVLSLPARFLEPISLRITVSGQESPLIPKSPSEMDAVIGTGNATPAYYTINNQIEFDCPADFAYPLTLRYYKRLDLAADTTNALLTSDPDIYLYASLLAASPYIKEDARILLWKQAVDEFVEEANSVASKARGQALMSVDVGLAGVGSFNVNTGDYRR
jgi:hypothetical protein